MPFHHRASRPPLDSLVASIWVCRDDPRPHALERILPTGSPQVALECGYYDQAHFIHEFRSFAGLTPTGYRGARTAFQNHVKFLQSGQAAV